MDLWFALLMILALPVFIGLLTLRDQDQLGTWRPLRAPKRSSFPDAR
jgi:hypothetical protein